MQTEMSNTRSIEARNGASESPGSPRPAIRMGAGAVAAQPPSPAPPSAARPPSNCRRPSAGPGGISLEGVIPGLADRFDIAAETFDRVAAGEHERTEREGCNQSQHMSLLAVHCPDRSE